MEIILEWMVRLMVWLSRWAEPLSRFGIIPYEKWHPGQKLKLLLVGYNGARNTGADARVVALVGQLMDELGERSTLTHTFADALLVEGDQTYFQDHAGTRF